MTRQLPAYRNLGHLLLEVAATHDRRVAFQIRRGLRTERTSYAEAATRARWIGAWLRDAGVERGDRIAVWAPNMPEYPLLFFGAWLAGVAVVPIDVRTPIEPLLRLLAVARPRMLFKSRFLEGDLSGAGIPVYTLEDLVEMTRGVRRQTFEGVGPDDVAEVVFTSGTTGNPKGVVITHGNLLAAADGMARLIAVRPSDRALSVLPLSHVLEQTIGLLLPLVKGARITYLPRTNATAIAKTMKAEAITCMVAVPEALQLFMRRIERQVEERGKQRQWAFANRLAPHLPRRLRRVVFRSVHRELGGHLRLFGCGGAPLAQSLAEGWDRLGVEVVQGYGLSETTAACSVDAHTRRRLGSVGKALPGVDVKLGEDDEILVRGPTVTPGYFEDPGRTAEAFSDGWLRTGDAGRFDEDGFLWITGRLSSRIILPDGRNVYPEDVERELNADPRVRDSCVVPLETPRGEQVYAVLLTDHGDEAAEIVRVANHRLAAHQQIAAHTVWPEPDLPRTAVLKPDRRRIREAIRHPGAPTAAGPGAEGPFRDPFIAAIAGVTDVPAAEIAEDSELETDLGLDSIGRIELLSLLEEQLGIAIDEMSIGPATTVAELRQAGEGGETAATLPVVRWQRAWWARAAGTCLAWLAYRVQDAWLDLEIVHRERAARLPFPSLLIFNYQGPYAPLLMLRAIPPHLRSRVAIAVDSRLWKGNERWQGALLSLAAQAFPFEKSGGAVRVSVEEVGRWLDDGYAVIIAPEGDPEDRGELLPFLDGTGLLAVEAAVPIVPFRIDGYWRLFEPDAPFPHLAARRGKARVIVGEQLRLPAGTAYATATRLAREALEQTD